MPKAANTYNTNTQKEA